MTSSKNHLNYMPQLDGLRAVAVGMVIISHWLIFIPSIRAIEGGQIGVHLFFVLSGYLITGILVDARESALQTRNSKRQILKGFYGRRFLRIFPLFYLVLLLSLLSSMPNIKEYFTWHALYLSNILIMLKGEWIGEASHLWSLAVEEQFYLFWPFVMLFTPRRYLLHTIVFCVLLSPVFKISYMLFGSGDLIISTFTLSSFHTLGAGALVALLQKTNTTETWKLISKVLFWLAVAGLLVYFVLQRMDGIAYNLISDIALMCLLTGLVVGAANGFTGLPGRILSCGPVLYLGKISYGLYLIHNFIPELLTPILMKTGFVPDGWYGIYILLTFHSMLLLGICTLSWYLFESRLNGYKKYFPYVLNREIKVA